MATIQFFYCSCPLQGNVMLDGVNLGPNKDGPRGKLLAKQCNEGLHEVSLLCLYGKRCSFSSQRIRVQSTDPISPLEVRFECAN